MTADFSCILLYKIWNLRMKKILPLALLLTSVTANAESIYLVGGLGLASYDITQDDANTLNATIDTGAVMIKGAIGSEINENFSIEAGYTYLGILDVVGINYSGDISTGGLEASLIVNKNLANGASIYGRVGAYAWETEFEFTGTGRSASSSANGSDITYGIGFDKNSWRLEYQRYNLGDMGVDTLQLSYKF
ncbi:MAG: hypothetical protein ACI9W6_002671 [Motiliproteus sp.]|jgi:hypothetical protein